MPDVWDGIARTTPASSSRTAPLDEVPPHHGERPRWTRERLRFVKGKVEDTIPGEVPERIALLRLDTDWYESTRTSSSTSTRASRRAAC